MGFTVAMRNASTSAPLSLIEAHHREKVLSSARVLAALCALIVIRIVPSVPGRYPLTAHVVVLLYLLHSLVTLVLVRLYQDGGPSFIISVHAADILWPGLISLFTAGPNSPFFVLFAIAVLAAAYRWGLRETLATSLACVLVFLGETVFATSSMGARFHVLHGRFHYDVFIPQIISLVAAGVLIGYLGEGEKRLRGETLAVRRILQKANPEASLTETLEDVLQSILTLFDATRASLVLRDLAAERVFLWESGNAGEKPALLKFTELDAAERNCYLFPMPGTSWSLQQSQRGDPYRICVLNDKGRPLNKIACALPGNLFSGRPFRSLLAVTFKLGNEWSGRIFLFDLRGSSGLESDLRFLQELIAEAAPALHSIYLLRRSRSRVRAIERTRVARDLHDGVIQSLIALEMQVETLRRQASGVSLDATEKLENVRNLLRLEVINLRELMEQLRRDEAAPPEMLSSVAEMVEKFRQETGIHAVFTSELEAAVFPPRVSREVTQIVHEALANIRKHSGASDVRVHLALEDGQCKLTIEDNGRGFEFSGRFSQADLDLSGKGPRVIRERVHSIQGDLAIESHPSQGARLEIHFAPKVYG